MKISILSEILAPMELPNLEVWKLVTDFTIDDTVSASVGVAKKEFL